MLQRVGVHVMYPNILILFKMASMLCNVCHNVKIFHTVTLPNVPYSNINIISVYRWFVVIVFFPLLF
uniref:Uncharacterized protein n=1 Tax=Arundo donax TaxID=35708 RepID=A0A0A9FJD3_ARUDO